MTNLKRKKNNIKTLVLITFISLFSLNIYAEETQCKTFDIKCKASKYINETKDFQNKGSKDSKKQIKGTKDQIKGTKDQIKGIKDKVIEALPKKK